MSLPPFQAVLDSHGGDLSRFLVASVGPSEADDCFQETVIAAMRAYPRLNHGRNLRAWLLRIGQRKAIDAHRARSRRPLPVEHLPADWPGGDRLAIHATRDESSIGKAVSLGCMRVQAAHARWLIDHVPLGTPVFIRS